MTRQLHPSPLRHRHHVLQKIRNPFPHLLFSGPEPRFRWGVFHLVVVKVPRSGSTPRRRSGLGSPGGHEVKNVLRRRDAFPPENLNGSAHILHLLLPLRPAEADVPVLRARPLGKQDQSDAETVTFYQFLHLH